MHDETLSTVADAFAATARHAGEAPFLAILPETAAIYGIDSGEISYATAAARIAALQAAYHAAGYGHGHRVGLLLENRPAFFMHWIALNGLGVSVVPINAELRSAELEYLIAHSELCLVVALASRHAVLAAAARAVDRDVALMADGDEPPRAVVPIPRHDAVTGSSECALLYTSGTTGRPKGCMLSNRYFMSSGLWYAGLTGLAALRPGVERMLTPLPLVHMNAMACSAMAMILTGGCLIMLDRFHPRSWWDSVRTSRATVVHYLGVMPAMLMKAAPSDDDRRHHVRFGFGAGVERQLHAPFEERYGFPLIEAWAMTETGAASAIIANHEPRQRGTSCFGRPSDDVEIRLVDDAGRDAGVDQPGELLIRRSGPDARDGFFSGYFKDEAATAEAWKDGWFHTGDLVSRDAMGLLHFIDRRKNVIRRSGENISAVEVESVLNQHPAIKACAVTSTPDPVRGDEVIACIMTHAPVSPDEQAALAAEIVAHALQRLAYFKAPGYVAFVDAIPLTASQKIQRGDLKAMALTLPGQAACIDTRPLKKRQD